MSLTQLITRMSGRTPRFVTVSGQVISSSHVVASNGAYHHPQHGVLTPVARHTNHGGHPPNEGDHRPWWETDPDRLEQERPAMAVAFPGFIEVEHDGRPAWRGTLNTGRGEFEVTVVHRPDHGLPHVVPSHPSLFRRKQGRRFVNSPHLYLNGNLCVAGQDDWDADRYDATVVTAWTAHWLATFTTWRITGRAWPCDGSVVDPDAA